MKRFNELLKQLKDLEAFHKKAIEDQSENRPTTKKFNLKVNENKLTLQDLEEKVGLELAAGLVPKPVLAFLKRKLQGKKYVEALKLANKMFKDTSRKISFQQALVKASETYGINPRNLLPLLKKGTVNR